MKRIYTDCLRLIIIAGVCLLSLESFSQHDHDVVVYDTTAAHVKDARDILRKMLNKKVDTTKKKKEKGFALLPSLGYNPSFGFIIGAKASAIRQFGNSATTDLSAFGLEGLYTSKDIITGQVRHNVFTADNKWNINGNWQMSRFLITDYGIGTGNAAYRNKSDSVFPIRFNYLRLTERAYRKVGKNIFAGAGASFHFRDKIDDEKLDTLDSTPHYRYSLRNRFHPKHYSQNAIIVGATYYTRDHPIRSYRGAYLDAGFAFSLKWLGSTKSAIQFIYDLRKYVGLSKRNPEHVLAFWHIASYKLDGTVPYLALQATAYDTYNRSGRGYTMGRFKGLSYSYFETEYRFPITRNKLLSGVAFANIQTASDDLGKKLYQYWDHAIGGGLRILFQKESRSTICVDYARGKYGASGFFFGLNEAF